ncbi:hypothetical protein [Bradyrhizobium sp. 191]|uniref:hypothetical protein n=1 Tax=Bradyrhizobium sp. 191 TaxID=2782659 RepID=UPI001FFECC4A|nr:hypothetical protein [Bradyrhizobium sp. 191]UPJ69372.1 hypothetical protein IVB23_13865 [Bradyrhizobium sp. 191]
MTKSRLFGYAVDEDEGKLLITIDGILAESCIRQIRESAQLGKGGQMLAELLPASSLYKFMAGPDKPEEEPLSLEELLGQNVDQSFTSFEQQLAELRESITELSKPASSE